LDWRYYSTSSF